MRTGKQRFGYQTIPFSEIKICQKDMLMEVEHLLTKFSKCLHIIDELSVFTENCFTCFSFLVWFS